MSFAQSFNRLRDNLDDWCTCINDETEETSERFIRHLYALVVGNGLTWIYPHFATDGEGEITFEWYIERGSLTFFITPGSVSFLRAWGYRIHRDMKEGTNPTDQELIDMWRVFFAGNDPDFEATYMEAIE